MRRLPGLLGAFLLVLGSSTLHSCGTTSERIDPDIDDEIGGGGIESGDVRSVSDKFSRDLLSWGPLFQGGVNPTIYFTQLENTTSAVIDKQIFLEKIETSLVRHSNGRLVFLDRSRAGMEAIQAERKAKREGAVTSSGQKALLGSDYVLKGTIRGIEKRRRDMRSTYYLITMELTDLESGMKVWKYDYEFKWMGDRSAIYQ
jgi:hypothetical protein